MLGLALAASGRRPVHPAPVWTVPKMPPRKPAPRRKPAFSGGGASTDRPRRSDARRPEGRRPPERSTERTDSRPVWREAQGRKGAPPRRAGADSEQGAHPTNRNAGALPLLYGINPVRAALQSKRRKLVRLFVREGELSTALDELHTTSLSTGLSVTTRATADLDRLCHSKDHQGVVLECGPLPVEDAGIALAFPLQDHPLLVALDQVEDPRNLGAIVRCCAAFGATGLITTRRHRAPFSAAASKASAGTLEDFPVFEAANLSRFLQDAKKRGYWIAGATAEKGQSLPSFQRETPLVLVMGSEGSGIRPLVDAQCDLHLSIPSPGGVVLNVATAAAVLLYQLTAAASLPALAEEANA